MRYAVFQENSGGVKFYGPFVFKHREEVQKLVNNLNINHPTIASWLVETDARKLECFNCLESSYLKDGICVPCMNALERVKADV